MRTYPEKKVDKGVLRQPLPWWPYGDPEGGPFSIGPNFRIRKCIIAVYFIAFIECQHGMMALRYAQNVSVNRFLSKKYQEGIIENGPPGGPP
jgi:hypothetical protein